MQYNRRQLLVLFGEYPALAALFDPFPFTKGDLERAGLDTSLADTRPDQGARAHLGGRLVGGSNVELVIQEERACSVPSGDGLKDADGEDLIGRTIEDSGRVTARIILKETRFELISWKHTVAQSLRRHRDSVQALLTVKVEPAGSQGRRFTFTLQSVRFQNRRRGRDRRVITGRHAPARLGA